MKLKNIQKLNLNRESNSKDKAVEKVLSKGYKTEDIYDGYGIKVTTKEIGDLISNHKYYK
ncbi:MULTISPECIES: isocitrate/isopropylmalate family dehydrogenase [unclassified Romboutsia]|uniref:isocitrate/isopropylmalate family dehydrogenase n=1 Tax=unclassified Romboutsia TaxID=2626894 RepID=UPI00082091D7|nr:MULTISPECIES: isocitrate/isopropylmalate family dehydrogenase [unclassified Romboutsia]SCH92922.1 Uncharacterised protein [uncultured Clostridium sp.]